MSDSEWAGLKPGDEVTIRATVAQVGSGWLTVRVGEDRWPHAHLVTLDGEEARHVERAAHQGETANVT